MTPHNPPAAEGCGCGAPEFEVTLIGIDEALARIAATVAAVPGTELVALGQAVGRVLDEPVRALSMTPPFDNSAMDGYALDTRSLTGDGPWRLPVTARIPAGQVAAGPLTGLAAAQVFTGAPLPRGADAVVMQEEVVRDGAEITLSRRPEAGEHVRLAGSDLAEGAVVLEPGCRLGPRHIAACAAAGVSRVRIRRALRVALLVTGDEVRGAGTGRAATEIWDINTPMLSGALATPAVRLVAAEHGADSLPGLTDQLSRLAASADLLVTTGGISVGEEDHVKPALEGLGARLVFSGVAIKPGKPVSFGMIGTTPWLGLPGNPLSAFVTWQLFGTALVGRLMGEGMTARRRHVVIADPIGRKPGRCELRPATLVRFDDHGREVVTFAAATHSGRVGGLPAANGLIFLPAEADVLPAGALVEFQPLHDC